MDLEKPQELKAEINRRIRLLQGISSVLTGRQLLWLICRWFRTKEECGGMYGIMDLAKVTLKDNPSLQDLTRWRQLWCKVCEHQRVKVDDITARETFVRELRKAPQLRYSLELYDHMDPEDPTTPTNG